MECKNTLILKGLAKHFLCKFYPSYSDKFEAMWNSVKDNRLPCSAFADENSALMIGATSVPDNMKMAMHGLVLFSMYNEDGKTKMKIHDAPKKLMTMLTNTVAEYFSPNTENSKNELLRECDNSEKLYKMIEDGITKTLSDKIDSSKSEIIGHIKRPAFDPSLDFDTGFEVNITGKDLDNAVLNIEVKFGVKSFSLSRPHAIFIALLALRAKISRAGENVDDRWLDENEIYHAIPEWSQGGKKKSRYPSGVAREIKDKLGTDFGILLGSERWKGYRLSTHPDFIKISDDIIKASQSIVNKDREIGRLISKL